MSWNVRSIANKFDDVKNVINNCTSDVVCLQEIWHVSDSVDLSIPGFHKPRIITRTKSRGGGLIMYAKSGLSLKEIKSPFLEKNLETQMFKITLAKDCIFVMNVYLGQLEKHANIKKLSDYINTFTSREKGKMFIMGDFNLDLLKLGECPDVDYAFDSFAEQGFVPNIKCPTRMLLVGKKMQISSIDNIYSYPNLTDRYFVINSNVSDHMPVILDTKRGHKNEKIEITISQTSQENLVALECALAAERWFPVFQATEVDEITKKFEEIKDDYIRRYVPTKKILVKPNRKQAWFTEGLQVSRKNLGKLKLKAKRSETDLSTYLRYKNLYSQITRSAKMQHSHDQLQACKKDIRQTWKTLDQILNRKKKGGTLSHIFNIDGKTTNNKLYIANAFNDHYTTIGSKLAKKFDPTSDYEKYLPENAAAFDLEPVRPEEVEKLIRTLKAKRSHGHDLLTNAILKKMSYVFLRPLTFVINESIRQNKFPTIWKTTRVIPLYKSGDQSEILNYRPISLSPVGSKILEKVVNAQVIGYLKERNLLPDTQYGFRKKSRTTHLVLKLIKIIEEALASGKKVLVTFLDFSKAFDTIPHDQFLRKLESLGFTFFARTWFESYLGGRNQYTEFHGVMSGYLPVTCGVPQGTVMGPLIFLLYTCDVNQVPEYSLIFSFADDTTLVTIGDDVASLQLKANRDYAKLSDWYAHSRLSLNVKKTKYILFGSGENMKLEIQNTIIDRVSHYKLVGITIDEKLNWEEHARLTLNRLKSTFVMLCKTKRQLDTKNLTLLYNSLFRSVMTYGLEFYGAATKTTLRPIQILQNKIIRMIGNYNKETSTADLYRALKILKLEDEIILSRLQLAKSCTDSEAPDHIKSILTIVNKSRMTRYAQEKIILTVPNPKSERGLRSVTYTLPSLWNNLDSTAHHVSPSCLSNFIKRQLLEIY
jgi:hypothetical protein